MLCGRFVPRWMVALVWVCGCHSNVGTNSTSPPADATAGDGCAPCILVDSQGGTVSVPCGSNGCASGIAYECSREGNVIATTCGAFDASTCEASCPDNQCGLSNECGGVCGCDAGQMCVLGMCSTSNCRGSLGSYCDETSDSGALCCRQGTACLAPEGGAPTCCALTNGGPCTSNSDCCDPTRHCNAVYSTADVLIDRVCN